MNLVFHTLGRFVTRLAGVATHLSQDPEQLLPPSVDNVLRIGYAGHLHVQTLPHLQHAVRDVLACVLAKAREGLPGVVVHAVGQLAPGADTIVAREALAQGCQLHAILPGSVEHVVHDIASMSNGGAPSQAEAQEMPGQHQADFYSLLQQASRVLQLDAAAADPAKGLGEADYEQCAEVMLTRLDCLVALEHSDAGLSPGGTRWMVRRARSLGIPVIVISVDRPGVLMLISGNGVTDIELAFDADEGQAWVDAVSQLVGQIIAPLAAQAFPFRPGRFESGFLSQLDIGRNQRYWEERWLSPSPGTSPGMAELRAHVDTSLGRWAIWADHRASGMAELVRGAFIFCALLGLLAVFCALSSLMFPQLSMAAKVVEVSCFLVVLWFIARDRKMRWRDQWHYCRQLERRLNHAAWLTLVGREVKHDLPAEIRAFHGSRNAGWMSEFSCAVIRSVGIPNLKFDRAYLQTARSLVLHRLIREQADYCRSEVSSQRAADHLLERWIWRTFWIALVITGTYLALKTGAYLLAHTGFGAAHPTWFDCEAEHVWHQVSKCVSAVGIVMPCIAAALASIRSHGDYAQLATRYAGVGISLEEAEQMIERVCPAGAREDAACTSRNIAVVIQHVVALLGHESTSWSAIVQTKEIEPS